jgi:hypothetical protein
MIKWLRLQRLRTESYLTVEMNCPVASLEIAERWAQWKYPTWQVVCGSPLNPDMPF